LSEISQSLHLWRASRTEARDLLNRLSESARIVASNDRWTCVVPVEVEALMAIARAAPAIVALWSYVDDYALEIVFFRDGTELGQLVFSWHRDAGFEATSNPESPTDELKLAGVLTHEAKLELAALSEEVQTGRARGEAVRDRAASLLGLAAYDWLSSETCFDISLEEHREQFPEAEDVEPHDQLDS
jgi:hypothetical protein